MDKDIDAIKTSTSAEDIVKADELAKSIDDGRLSEYEALVHAATLMADYKNKQYADIIKRLSTEVDHYKQIVKIPYSKSNLQVAMSFARKYSTRPTQIADYELIDDIHIALDWKDSKVIEAIKQALVRIDTWPAEQMSEQARNLAKSIIQQIQNSIVDEKLH